MVASLEGRGQRPGLARPSPGDVVCLAAIDLQVVQLRDRRLDVFQGATYHGPQRHPAVGEPREVAFHLVVDGVEISTSKRRHQGAAVDLLHGRKIEEIQHRRCDVDQADVATDDLVRGDPGTRQDQRDPLGRLVEEDAVGRLAVLAEAFAVIAGDHGDQRARFSPGRRHDPAHLPVDEGDLAVVGSVRKAGLEGLGGDVRPVRVVVVHPQKERRGQLVDALEDGLRGVAGRALLVVECSTLSDPHVVVVDVEAPVEPQPSIEHRRRDERHGLIAGRAESLGQHGRSGCWRGSGA